MLNPIGLKYPQAVPTGGPQPSKLNKLKDLSITIVIQSILNFAVVLYFVLPLTFMFFAMAFSSSFISYICGGFGTLSVFLSILVSILWFIVIVTCYDNVDCQSCRTAVDDVLFNG